MDVLLGFSGPTCAVNVNECSPNPCLNGATCIDEIDHYTCHCLPGIFCCITRTVHCSMYCSTASCMNSFISFNSLGYHSNVTIISVILCSVLSPPPFISLADVIVHGRSASKSNLCTNKGKTGKGEIHLYIVSYLRLSPSAVLSSA